MEVIPTHAIPEMRPSGPRSFWLRSRRTGVRRDTDSRDVLSRVLVSARLILVVLHEAQLLVQDLVQFVHELVVVVVEVARLSLSRPCMFWAIEPRDRTRGQNSVPRGGQISRAVDTCQRETD